MKLIAHRANDKAFFKENSKEAVLNCLKQDYIAGVELDCRLTKDKKVVLSHSNLLYAYPSKLFIISQNNYRELKKKNRGDKKHPSYLATLESVLKKIKGQKKIIIEIKHELGSFQELADCVDALLKKYASLNFYVCSFSHEVLDYLKQKKPTYKLGLLIGLFQNEHSLYHHFDFNMVSFSHYQHVDRMKETFIWTINKKEQLEQIMKYDLEYAVITDVPYLFQSYL